MNKNKYHCPLCKTQNNDKLCSIGSFNYHTCKTCFLVFMSPSDRLETITEEKSRYDFHENNPEDQGYVNFLSKLTNPLQKHITSNSKGLDFGCGPGPTIDKIFEKQGIECNNYDLIYYNNKELLSDSTYDFVTASECFEHFYDPEKEINTIKNILKKSGVLGIMTSILYDDIQFQTWYYPKDDTHVVFYRPQTFEWIAKKFNFEILEISKNVIILKNN